MKRRKSGKRMPIDYSKYHKKWTLIRRLILKRADNRCEMCNVSNYAIGWRNNTGRFHVDQGHTPNGAKIIKIILTIAHLDHDKRNNRFDNLKALCQRCHLNHDRPQYVHSRKYGRDTKYLNYSLDL